MWITPAIIGLFTGSIGGFFGISGAFIILSLLSHLKVVPDQRTAAGTTLFSILPPVTILAVWVYYQRKQIDFKIGTIIMISYIIGGWIGAKYSNYITESSIKLLLVFLLLILALMNFIDYMKSMNILNVKYEMYML